MIRAVRIAVVVVLLSAAAIAGAQEVGTVAEVDGAAELGRAGTWQPAAIGVPLALGDQVRTGKPGRVRIVFQDDSVLNVSDNSQVTIDTQVFDPSAGKSQSLFHLLRGKVNAIVSDYYKQPGARYEIKTQTAVAGVRGTEFVMTYDPDTDVSEVIGITGRVEVHSAFDPEGAGVFITEREATTIVGDQPPSPPRRRDDTLFRQDIEGLSFIGAGKPESLTLGSATLLGVPADKLATDKLPAPGPVQCNPDPSSVVGQPATIIGHGRLGIRF